MPVDSHWTQNTAHRDLSLSEDNRKVTLVGEQQSYPDHPERFDFWVQMLCRESLTGRCYWEVERIGGVVIGVTYRGITRRGESDNSWLGGNNKSWSLDCYDAGYTAWYNYSSTDIRLPPPGSNRVGVVCGPACWHSVLLQSVPRCRRLLRHTDTHPHLPAHTHPGGPPPWVWVLWVWFLSVSVSVVAVNTHTHTHTLTHTHTHSLTHVYKYRHVNTTSHPPPTHTHRAHVYKYTK